MKNLKEKISIVMPAYNEAERIVYSIDETAKTFRDFGCAWELIIVDDGSTDGTYEKASVLTRKYPGELLVKRGFGHIGKGRAIKKALRYASGLKPVRNFPAQSCGKEDIICLGESGEIEVFEVVAAAVDPKIE